MSHSGDNGHPQVLTPEQRAQLLHNLAQACGWKNAKEMKAAVLKLRGKG
jgi:Spy/CpxP family protein refolding chaperone